MDEDDHRPSLCARRSHRGIRAFLAALPECDGALCALACSLARLGFFNFLGRLAAKRQSELAARLRTTTAPPASSAPRMALESNAATTIRQSRRRQPRLLPVVRGAHRPATSFFPPDQRTLFLTVPGFVLDYLASRSDGIAFEPGWRWARRSLDAWLAFGTGMAFSDWLGVGLGTLISGIDPVLCARAPSLLLQLLPTRQELLAAVIILSAGFSQAPSHHFRYRFRHAAMRPAMGADPRQ